jgi:hypothetical protein
MRVVIRGHLGFVLIVGLCFGLLAGVVGPARPARAAAPVVSGIGSGHRSDINGPLTLTISTTAPVVAGNSIVVAALFLHGGSATGVSISCSDLTNGAYSIDGPVVDSGDMAGAVCAKHNSAALASGTQITVQWLFPEPPSTRFGLADAVQISGLAANPLDQTVAANGSSATPDSGLAPATAQPRAPAGRLRH